MDISQVPGLPAAVIASASGVALVVSLVLMLLQNEINRLPGFGPDDPTRNGRMRVLTGVLNCLGLILVAWSQNVVIPRSALLAMLGVVVAWTVGQNGVYIGAKALKKKAVAAAAPSEEPQPAPDESDGDSASADAAPVFTLPQSAINTNNVTATSLVTTISSGDVPASAPAISPAMAAQAAAVSGTGSDL